MVGNYAEDVKKVRHNYVRVTACDECHLYMDPWMGKGPKIYSEGKNHRPNVFANFDEIVVDARERSSILRTLTYYRELADPKMVLLPDERRGQLWPWFGPLD